MTKLLSFEFIKTWKNYRILLVGIIALQIVLLLISKLTFTSKFNTALGFTLLVYLVTIIIMLVFPLIEGIYRFNKDLTGKQSVLELSIPITSWKKVLAKLIVSLCIIIFFMLLAITSLLAFTAIVTNSSKNLAAAFDIITKVISASPYEFIAGLLYATFTLASLLVVAYFCIALSNSISHKNKIAIPIGMSVFIAYCVATGLLAQQLNKFPVVNFKLWGSNYPLTAIIFDVVLFVLAFVGTSWLVEKKIEN